MHEISQYEAAVNHLLQILNLATTNPGLIMQKDLERWMTVAAKERHKQGDLLASQLLMKWAEGASKTAKANVPFSVRTKG